MKFELGRKIEQAENDAIRKSGEKLSWWEEYREFNRQEIDHLLELRSKGGKELSDRQALKLKKLKDAEKNGDLYITKNSL